MANPSDEEILNAARTSLQVCAESLPATQDARLMRQFIAAATGGLGALDSYKVFNPAVHQIATDIRKQYGAAALKIFLRAVLLQATADLVASPALQPLPPRLASNQRIQLLRIARDSDTSEAWLDLSHDIFHKEFGIATLRLFAAAAQLIDVRCGIARSVVLKQGLLGATGALLKFAKLGGFKPYFQIHTHNLYLDEFNERGWEECYRSCVDLYGLFPQSRGMFGSSWFHDPVIDEISPRMRYLRKTQEAGDAIFLFYAEGGDAITNALATSPSRRALYDAGKYMPKNYMLIWGREKQIAWAARNKTD